MDARLNLRRTCRVHKPIPRTPRNHRSRPDKHLAMNHTSHLRRHQQTLPPRQHLPVTHRVIQPPHLTRRLKNNQQQRHCDQRAPNEELPPSPQTRISIEVTGD
jgi:hypothetical protein